MGESQTPNNFKSIQRKSHQTIQKFYLIDLTFDFKYFLILTENSFIYFYSVFPNLFIFDMLYC
jgi:hypothetical protein